MCRRPSRSHSGTLFNTAGTAVSQWSAAVLSCAAGVGAQPLAALPLKGCSSCRHMHHIALLTRRAERARQLTCAVCGTCGSGGVCRCVLVVWAGRAVCQGVASRVGACSTNLACFSSIPREAHFGHTNKQQQAIDTGGQRGRETLLLAGLAGGQEGRETDMHVRASSLTEVIST